jgi:heme/copper-type cytochrome/quinol oxidase subunit 3
VPKFFFTAGILLFISSFATYVTYRINLRRVQLDIRDKTKTIEISHVMRKLQIPAKNTYHLYIDSTIKLSIEVSYEDYVRMAVGDEVCIEFTTHSREYLGYF